LFLLLVGLACLFPVSLYCLFLALLHQRRHPTMLSGSWDFAAVLVALSGFLLFGGTTLLFAFHTTARDAWLASATLADLRYGHARAGVVAFILWGLYGLLLIGGSAVMLWRRRNALVFYNLSPAEFELIIADICLKFGLPWQRRASRYYIGYTNLEKSPFGVDVQRKARLETSGSAAMRHVAVQWESAHPALRHELEEELGRAVADFETADSSVAGWFLTASGALMVLLGSMLVLFLWILRTRH
jgi:hypothetical protein